MTLLNYGPIGEDGSANVRIHYDHRVMDGANVARALERFEEILTALSPRKWHSSLQVLPFLQSRRIRSGDELPRLIFMVKTCFNA